MGMRRRFELVEGTSSKFWEIEVEGASHTVQFRKIGAKAQVKTKTLASDAAAAADAEKLIREKRSKGYREVDEDEIADAAARELGGDAAAGPAKKKKAIPSTRYTMKAPPGHVPMVFTLQSNRLLTNDLAQVFGSIGEAQEHLERVMKLRKREGYVVLTTEELTGEETEDAPVGEDEGFTVDPKKNGRWTVAFKKSGDVSAATCAKVLRRLEKDVPTSVQVLCDPGSPGPAWATAIASHRFPSVTSFVFDTDFQTQTRQGRNTLGSLAATLDAFPKLEQLFATGALELQGAGSHGSLRELYLLGDPMAPGLLKALGSCTFPNLERIVLSLASDAGPASGDLAAAALVGLRAPKLRALHVASVDDVASFVGKIAKAGPPRTWSVLGVSGDVDDEDALVDVVRANAGGLARLKTLGLPLGEISTDAGEAIQRLLPGVRDVADEDALTLPAVYKTWGAV